MEYIQFTKALEVADLERLRNSRNGNPRYRIRFSNGIEGTTKTDAGFVYGIHDGMKAVTARFHYTPAGRCVIDDMEERERGRARGAGLGAQGPGEGEGRAQGAGLGAQRPTLFRLCSTCGAC